MSPAQCRDVIAAMQEEWEDHHSIFPFVVAFGRKPGASADSATKENPMADTRALEQLNREVVKLVDELRGMRTGPERVHAPPRSAAG